MVYPYVCKEMMWFTPMTVRKGCGLQQFVKNVCGLPHVSKGRMWITPCVCKGKDVVHLYICKGNDMFYKYLCKRRMLFTSDSVREGCGLLLFL